MALCFLVFQLRILHSWYFQHCMIDFRCDSDVRFKLAGALLINQLIEKEMKEQNVQQQAKFDEIRSRTAAIRKQYEEQQLKGAQSLKTAIILE
uniref:Piezo domain-containing protein n=1 Tax=Panagrolaimus davidi TaxID=227884 RepID=A0A914PXK0_9BILA